MFNPHDLAAHLPAPRPDEPAELRRDIVDEIADHLTCATRREQLAGRVDETEAQRHALDRFGDPRRLARKLWWDSLRGRIMTQRLQFGLTLSVMLTCLAAIGLSWHWNRQLSAELAAQAQATTAATRELHELLLKNQPVSDWSPAEFRFVAGSADGPPQAGVKVLMWQNPRSSGMPPLRAESGADGHVRFNHVRYGTYLAKVESPFGDQLLDTSSNRLEREINVLPGEDFNQTIVCPAAPVEMRQVKVRVDWPEDLKDRKLAVQFGDFQSGDEHSRYIHRKIEGTRWSFGYSIVPESKRTQILIDQDGTLSRIEAGRATHLNYSLSPVLAETRKVLVSWLDRQLTSQESLLWPEEEEGFGYFPMTLIEAGEKELPGIESIKTSAGAPDSRVFVQIWGGRWAHRLESGPPATLVITPPAEDVTRIREVLKLVDEGKASGVATSTASPHDNLGPVISKLSGHAVPNGTNLAHP